MTIKLAPETVKVIEDILNSKKTVEIAVRKDNVIVWAVGSRKQVEQKI